MPPGPPPPVMQYMPAQPAQYARAPPTFTPELRAMHAHSGLSLVGNGYLVAIITSTVSFLVMYFSRARIFGADDSSKSRFKMPIAYSIAILVLILLVQRLARLGSYRAIVNPHTILAACVLFVLGVIAALSNHRASKGTNGFDHAAIKAGVRRATAFAHAAAANPDRFEATQQAALAEGHLYAFATLFDNDHERLSKAAGGAPTAQIAQQIREIRSSFYGVNGAPVPPPPPRPHAQALRR